MIWLRGNFLVPTEPDPDNAGVGTKHYFFAFTFTSALLDVFYLEVFMKASVAIQVLPKVESDQEVCRIVDEVIAYIKSTGLNYFVGPCETSIEGEDYEQLMEIVKNCQLIAIKAGAPSVSAYVKISYRPNGEVLSIEKKTKKYHQEQNA